MDASALHLQREMFKEISKVTPVEFEVRVRRYSVDNALKRMVVELEEVVLYYVAVFNE